MLDFAHLIRLSGKTLQGQPFREERRGSSLAAGMIRHLGRAGNNGLETTGVAIIDRALCRRIQIRKHDYDVEPSQRISSAHLYQRHPADLLRAAAGAISLLISAALAHRGHPGTFEIHLFRLLNQMPGALGPPLSTIMQLGSLAAVPIASGVALAYRRFRFAFDLAVAGSLAWILARLVKDLVERGRPATLIDHVSIRDVAASGYGFPSGHAAVAAALATVASPYLSRGGRRAAWAAVGIVAVARIFVGAHLPVDAFGGVVLGWTIGAGLHLLLGAPGKLLAPNRLLRALSEGGLGVAQVRPLTVDARGSTPYLVRLDDGTELFVKVVSREQRNADWIFKAWRFIAFREVEDEAPFATPKQQVEHEAYLALLAERAGVRTPSVVTTGIVGSSAFLVQTRVTGKNLDSYDQQELDNALIAEIWRPAWFAQESAHRPSRPPSSEHRDRR